MSNSIGAYSNISTQASTNNSQTQSAQNSSDSDDGGIDFSQLLSQLLDGSQNKKHHHPQLLQPTQAPQSGSQSGSATSGASASSGAGQA